MNHDKYEISIAINKIDSFLERASIMLSYGKRGERLPAYQEYSEQELKDIDNSLKILALKLLKIPDIAEDIWFPPVAYAYKHAYDSERSNQWRWLESFYRGLLNSKTFFKSFMDDNVVSPTYHFNNSSEIIINDVRGVNNIQVNNGFTSNEMAELITQLSKLRIEMRKDSITPEQDIAVAAVAAAEISAKKGDEHGVANNLKKAGKWAFEVATKIGIEVAAKALEPFVN